MMINEILFIGFGAVAALAVTVMLFTRNIMYAVFALVLTLMSTAAIYVLLSAEFVAVAQLMIYIGGVIVLLLFAVMLTQKTGNRVLYTSITRWLIAPVMVGLLLLLIIPVVWELGKVNVGPVVQQPVEKLGFRLLTEMLIPMELLALLLLVVLIGAASIAGQFFSIKQRSR